MYQGYPLRDDRTPKAREGRPITPELPLVCGTPGQAAAESHSLGTGALKAQFHEAAGHEGAGQKGVEITLSTVHSGGGPWFACFLP